MQPQARTNSGCQAVMVPKTLMNALRIFFLSLYPSKMMAEFMHFFHLFHISITFTPISLIALSLLFARPLSFRTPFHIPFIPLSHIPLKCPSYPHVSSNTLKMARNSLYFPELDRNCYI
jgi:hypothetical protein